jgi:hypothetical protein
MRRSARVVVFILAGAALLGACGGGASGGGASGAASANPTVLGADFAARALAACSAAHVMKQAEGPFPFPDFNPTRPDTARLPAVADYLEKTAATYTSWSAAMVALGQPTGGNAAWAALLAAVDQHGQLTRDQIDAARKGDTARFAADYDTGAKTQAALLQAAQDAGIPDCAVVDR